jgi:methionyl-tRNA synthetase
MDNEKMSKSLGNVVDPLDLVKEYGKDILRYFLLKEMSLETDTNFSKKLLLETYNADLANVYGNLVSRFIGMVHKFNNGVVKKPIKKNNPLTAKIITELKKTVNVAKKNINKYEINTLIYNILAFAKKVNKYIECTKP